MIPIPLNRIKANQKVDLWDIGPQVAPKAPAEPAMPDKAKLKGADLAAAELEYEDAYELYKDELRAYTAAKRAHLDWIRDKGGPIKVEFWGVDASDAMEIEPTRYMLDLPRGVKPGKAQAELEDLAKEAAEEVKRARSRDPLHSGAMA